jgi:hypothetical protein
MDMFEAFVIAVRQLSGASSRAQEGLECGEQRKP